MTNLYDILIKFILPVFVDVEKLDIDIGVSNWGVTYLDLFKFLFVVVSSYIVVWLFLIMPFRILQKIMRYRDIKGGKR